MMMLLAALGMAEPTSLTYQIDNQLGIWYEGLSGSYKFSQSEPCGLQRISSSNHVPNIFYEGIH